jgi:hypothetical protein
MMTRKHNFQSTVPKIRLFTLVVQLSSVLKTQKNASFSKMDYGRLSPLFLLVKSKDSE